MKLYDLNDFYKEDAKRFVLQQLNAAWYAYRSVSQASRAKERENEAECRIWYEKEMYALGVLCSLLSLNQQKLFHAILVNGTTALEELAKMDVREFVEKYKRLPWER